ncbi:O-antigen ligase family protein [Aliifodinibius sp. S!AR15-10]|uniref:O-antigen ligase family protein n=1 Tax=Aliifodinibius sp. S!AR15-10 TaxID=2950437 RepID=UPI0028589E21|nr:O-antigen ligase family protein [Aliifodinibius sp. S!AR15-10]MDR8393377.1 O-antigen ligase family protein [Aliifodinibius sp. S!AR15-10]
MTVKKESIDYFNIFIGLCLSGNPLFTSSGYFEVLLILFSIYLTAYYLKGVYFSINSFLLISICYSCLFFIQIFSFGTLNAVTYIGFIVKLYIGYVLFTSIKQFDTKFISVVRFLVVISIPFFLLNLAAPNLKFIIPSFSSFIYDIEQASIHIGIYNFMLDSSRNAGMFWEPGAFAGYIALALTFLFINKKSGKSYITKNLVLFSIGIITTMSTTGYIALTILIVFYFYLRNDIGVKRRALYVVLLPFLIFFIYTSFNKYDFLEEKIKQQYIQALDREDNWRLNRFGTLIMDWEYIKNRPLTGWGFHQSTRYQLNPSDAEIASGAGNGMSDFIAKTGIPSFFLFLFLVYKGARKKFTLTKLESITVIAIILVLLQGEGFLNFPVFLGLFFTPFLK